MRRIKKFTAALLAAALFTGLLPAGSIQAAEPETAVQIGDADGDGKITASDALAILKHLARLQQKDFIEAAANTDGEGGITSQDALAILKYLAGLMKQFPIDCTEHAFGEGKVVKKPTLKEEGLIVYTCMKCGYQKSEAIPVLEECIEHEWDDGVFLEYYFSPLHYDENSMSRHMWGDDGRYWPFWMMSYDPYYEKDTNLLDFRIVSEQCDEQGEKYHVETESWDILRYADEGMKEYTCRICGEKKIDFCLEKRTVPTKENAVKMRKWSVVSNPELQGYGVAGSNGFAPEATGWAGKENLLTTREELGRLCFIEEELVPEPFYSTEQEAALDALSAQFVSGHMGLWEYEAAVREYLSGLGIYDTSETGGELLIGCQIYFDEQLNWAANPYVIDRYDYRSYDKEHNYHTYDVNLGDLPYQYLYVNSYWDIKERDCVNFTIALYVENPLISQ